jgi:NAD(P)-dependent dehydrogenase (short-subunit alcohol dehydrogenase family)
VEDRWHVRAVVTSATSGLGAAMADVLLEAGVASPSPAGMPRLIRSRYEPGGRSLNLAHSPKDAEAAGQTGSSGYRQGAGEPELVSTSICSPETVPPAGDAGMLRFLLGQRERRRT